MKNNITHIVLLGGGYTSVWAYRMLVKKLRGKMAQDCVRITVVCPEEYHFFHGWTAESLAGIIQDQNRMSPLAEILPKAQLINGIADEIDASGNLVHIKLKDGSKQTLHYDHLLVGIGSFDSEAVEGISKYGYQIKSHAAYQRTKQNLQSIVKRAAVTDPATARKLLSITIAGGGFAGVELAANIAELIAILKKQYASLQNIKPAIQLVNSSDHILDTLQPGLKRMRRYAEKTMHRYGIEIVNHSKIVRVTEQGAHLNSGTFIPCSMVISLIGQSRIILKGTEKMERDNVKRICTNDFLQIEDHENIWGGGDACHVKYRKTAEPCPANALWAIKHGEYIGNNIARSIRQQPLKSFDFKGLGQCASLGVGKGVGELYGLVFTGWLAWIMRWCFFNYFMPSKRVMWNSISDWMYLLFFRERKAMAMQRKRTITNPWLSKPEEKTEVVYRMAPIRQQAVKTI
jgi:NADH dehydrogenase